jgi:hypothetical protein
VTARDCVCQAASAGPAYQRIVNTFVDEFRAGDAQQRQAAIAAPVETSGPLEGLVAAVVSALCRETGTQTPDRVADVGSPVPFFAFPATSYEMRERLMIESPPPFRIRNVFVPENYLSRA